MKVFSLHEKTCLISFFFVFALIVFVCNYIGRNVCRMVGDVPVHEAKTLKPRVEKQRHHSKQSENNEMHTMIWDKCNQDLEIKNLLFQIKSKYSGGNDGTNIINRIVKSLKTCDEKISLIELMSRINNPPVKDTRRIEIVKTLKLMLNQM